MRVAVILTARPSWAKLSPVVGALLAKGADVQLVVCASALLERYGRVVDQVRQEYPDVPLTECWSTYEGATLLTSAKETGALLSDLSTVLHRLQVARVVVCADRHEVVAAAQSAAYLHLPLVHLQGGERSGSIDDKARDAITALSDYHCVCTPAAAMRVYALTGDYARIRVTGCPSIDLAHQVKDEPPVTRHELGGVGPDVDPEGPFLTLLQHPVTSEPDSYGQMQTTLEALGQIHMPLVAFWPGEDAGQEGSAKALRDWREARPSHSVRYVKTLPPKRFLKLLTQTRCLVGNSSAGIREASYLGTPVVNIGSRQTGRERASNVVDVPHDVTRILDAVQYQRLRRYPSSPLYGRGDAAQKIAEVVLG